MRVLIPLLLLALLLLNGAAEAFARPKVVYVPLDGWKALAGLLQSGADVAHQAGPSGAVVVLHGRRDRVRLREAGFSWVPLPSADSRIGRTGASEDQGLPSGRSTYRVYDDYVREMRTLAEQNPGLVKLHSLGTTLDGEEILGLEIALNVAEPNGRPVFLQFGLHHAREWPSGELPMEFALDVVSKLKGGDARIAAIAAQSRLMVVPVVNVDGFRVSRGSVLLGSGVPTPRRGVLGAGGKEYQRKNCRPPSGAGTGRACGLRTDSPGVDLNRNYGYFWGGAGAGLRESDETFRGKAPFSEPETQAVHALLSRTQATVVATHHTFYREGLWLRLPGFRDTALFPQGRIPDETLAAALGELFSAATGWISAMSCILGDVTGSTDDWSYFARGAISFTSEARGEGFHGRFRDAVAAEYIGWREAVLRAAEASFDPSNHSIITGSAPAGAIITLDKSFLSPACGGHTQRDACSSGGGSGAEALHEELRVPASGSFSWHVNPSSRPLNPGEAWTIACNGGPAREVRVERGETAAVGALDCPAGPLKRSEPGDVPHAKSEALEVVVAGVKQVSRDLQIELKGDMRHEVLAEWDLDGDGKFIDGEGSLVIRHYLRAGRYLAKVRVRHPSGRREILRRPIIIRE